MSMTPTERAEKAWFYKRNKVIGEILDLEPRFDAIRLASVAKDSGLLALMRIRNDARMMARLLDSYGK